MSTLKLKNKYAASFTKMVRQADQIGGIPDKIEVSTHEAEDILREIRDVKSDSFTISVTGEDPRFYFNKLDERDVIEHLIIRWHEKDFVVKFHMHLNDNSEHRIPIVVVMGEIC